MWWYLIKESDDENYVIYTYGYENKEQSGRAIFDRTTGGCKVVKIADGDDSPERVVPYIQKIILYENAPDKRQIALG
jgi:hypothetical protein